MKQDRLLELAGIHEEATHKFKDYHDALQKVRLAIMDAVRIGYYVEGNWEAGYADIENMVAEMRDATEKRMKEMGK